MPKQSRKCFGVNSYKTSTGDRYTQKQIEVKIRAAKIAALQNQNNDFGYNFCEDCGCNGSGTRLDCSHDYSVKKAKEEGKTEQCWNVKNIIIRCRSCHEKHDKLNLNLNFNPSLN